MATKPSKGKFGKTLLERVRKGAVRQPQQRGFLLQDWYEAFADLDKPSLEDAQLLLSAAWFDEQLTRLREMMAKVSIEEVPRALRIRCTIALANREHVVLSQKVWPRIKKAGRRSGTVPMDKMRGGRVATSMIGETFTPDEISTVSVDLLSYPLDQAIGMEPKRLTTKIGPDEQFSRIIKASGIANIYHVLVDYWLACLWRGWRLTPGEKVDIFAPSDVEEAKQYASSEYRQESWMFADAIAASKFWFNLDENERIAVNNRKTIVGVDRKNSRREFVIRRSNVDPKRPPHSFVLIFSVLDGITENLIDLPFPTKPSLTIKLLIYAWEVLRTLVEQSLDLDARTSVDTIESLRRFEITLKHSELRSVFSRCFDSDDQLAEDLVEFLSYQPRSQNNGGLWARPLVEFSDGKFAIVAAPLLIGNPLRSVEFWLRLGGVDVEVRGAAFESAVRESVAENLKNSLTLRDANVHMGKLELGLQKEEIDLIFRLGKTILVGEVKCHVFPSDPIEIHNYINGVLDEAVAQAKRKSNVARKEKEALEALFGTSLGSGPEVKVVPLVVTNLAIGAGNGRSGVPILDVRYLNRYLKYGYFDFQTTVSPDGVFSSEQREYLYQSEQEAENDCQGHFLNQPVLRRFCDATVQRVRPIPSTGTKPAGWVYYEVDGEVLHKQTSR